MAGLSRTPINYGRIWTGKDEQALIKLYNGNNISECMQKLGRSRGGIQSRLATLGLLDASIETFDMDDFAEAPMNGDNNQIIFHSSDRKRYIFNRTTLLAHSAIDPNGTKLQELIDSGQRNIYLNLHSYNLPLFVKYLMSPTVEFLPTLQTSADDALPFKIYLNYIPRPVAWTAKHDDNIIHELIIPKNTVISYISVRQFRSILNIFAATDRVNPILRISPNDYNDFASSFFDNYLGMANRIKTPDVTIMNVVLRTCNLVFELVNINIEISGKC